MTRCSGQGDRPDASFIGEVDWKVTVLPVFTATWSLTTLQRTLRQAPDGLPQVSTG